jgi:hypothetical protein
MPDGVKPAGQSVAAAALWRAISSPTDRTKHLKPMVRTTVVPPMAPDNYKSAKTNLTPAKGPVALVADNIRDGVTLPVAIQNQKGNACGTTSLSMILKYFKVPAAASDVAAIDRAIRPSSSDAKIDSFTAPIDIALYAQRHGMRATLHNDSSTDDLKAMLAQGVPPMILYDWDAPSGKGLHYVVVTGHREKGGDQEWQLHDPSGYSWHIDDKELKRRWSNLRVAGVEVPYNRLMISISPAQGYVQTPVGTTKKASEILLPSHNTSTVVDFAATIATWGVGVGANAYDAGRWIAGKAQAGAAAVASSWNYVTQAVTGALKSR